MILFLVSTIVQLAVLGAIVVGVVRLVKRRTGPRNGTASLRRFFTYGLLAASVIVAASGAWGLIVRVLEPPLLASEANTALARSLAFTLVGLPVAIGLLRMTLLRLEDGTDEATSVAWRSYVTAAATLSLLAVMISAGIVLAAAFGLTDHDPAAVAWLIVSALVWGVHWAPPLRRHHPPSGVHLMLGTLLGFGAVVGGVGTLLGMTLDRIYGALFTTEIAASEFGDAMIGAGIALAIGAAAWVWHWFRPDRSEWSDLMWHGWVLIGGVLPGVLAALGAAATTLVALLIWLRGDAGGDAAAEFFEFLPAAIATGITGGVGAAYHRRVHAGSLASRTEPARAYDYLLAAVGLGAAVAGIATLLVAFFGTVAGSVAAGDDSSVNVLLAALVGVGMGVPVWHRFWSRADRFAGADPEAEVTSTSRRTYVMAVLGIAGISGLISTIGVLFLSLEDALDSTLGSATLYDMRVPLAIMLATGLVAWYHRNVFRNDQRVRPEAVEAPKHVVFVSAPGHSFIEQLEAAVGGPVDRWETTGESSAETLDANAVAAAVSAAPGDDVLVLVGKDGRPLVVPFRTSSI